MIAEVVNLLERFTTWQSLLGYLGLAAFFGFGPGFSLELLLKVAPDDDFETRKAVVADLHSRPYLKRWWFVAEQAVGVVVYGAPDRLRHWWAKHYANQPDQRRSDIHYRVLTICTVAGFVGLFWDSFAGPVPTWLALSVTVPSGLLSFVAVRAQRRMIQAQRAGAEASLTSAVADVRADLLIVESKATQRLLSERVDELNAVTLELAQLLDQMKVEPDQP